MFPRARRDACLNQPSKQRRRSDGPSTVDRICICPGFERFFPIEEDELQSRLCRFFLVESVVEDPSSRTYAIPPDFKQRRQSRSKVEQHSTCCRRIRCADELPSCQSNATGGSVRTSYLVLGIVREVERVEMRCEDELARCVRVEGVDEVREHSIANRGGVGEWCLR